MELSFKIPEFGMLARLGLINEFLRFALEFEQAFHELSQTEFVKRAEIRVLFHVTNYPFRTDLGKPVLFPAFLFQCYLKGKKSNEQEQEEELFYHGGNYVYINDETEKAWCFFDDSNKSVEGCQGEKIDVAAKNFVTEIIRQLQKKCVYLWRH